MSVRLLFIVLFAAGCSSSTTELTIVTGFPAKENAPRQADMRKDFTTPQLTLKIGEVNPVRNLDPLFAMNEASQRIAGWVYEGLTGYDSTGRLKPNLAASWSISPDSLSYTFRLRSSAYFHDDPFLASGAGRKVTAADVKRVFERMAQAGVPPHAARLFSASIRGFDAYFNEQHEVYDASDRRIPEIAGIEAQNDSTVVFRLNVPDRRLLHKMATPWAFIYPVEAVTTLEKGLRNHPVGTGAFKFLSAMDDSVWVFEPNRKHLSYAGRPEAAVARLEVQVNPNEAMLYRQLATGDLHILVEAGPATARMVSNDKGELMEAFKSLYDIYIRDAQERLEVHVNTGNYDRFSKADALALVQSTALDPFIPQLSPQLFGPVSRTLSKDVSTIQKIRSEYPAGNASSKRITFAFQNDQLSRHLCRLVGNEWNRSVSMQLVQSAIISRDIMLYAARPVVYLPALDVPTPSDSELFSVRTKRMLVSQKGVSGIQQNQWSWWFNVTNVVIPVEKALQP